MADSTTVDKEAGFVVVPSHEYHMRVFEVLKRIAEEHDNLRVDLSKDFSSRARYVLSYVELPVLSEMSPFSKSGILREFVVSYDPTFTAYKKENNKFISISHKQIFSSQQKRDDHFDDIYKMVKEIIVGVLESIESGEES